AVVWARVEESDLRGEDIEVVAKGRLHTAATYEIGQTEAAEPTWRIAVLLPVGRWTGASIAGLVVGAMGVFVFAMAVRHWLRERRAVTELEAS
ncbi:unnamed protein product, partial [marine sediment metagenome]